MPKKLLSILIVTVITLFTACKKDPPIHTASQNTASTTTNTITPIHLFNIWYKLWNPSVTTSTPCGSYWITCSDSLVVSLDSTNLYKVTLHVGTEYAGVLPGTGGMVPEYNNSTSIISYNNNIYVSCGKGQPYVNTHTNISSNTWINDSLTWYNSILLSVDGNYYTNHGWWDNTPYTDDYIGIKITSPSGNRYGWIKLSKIYTQSNSVTMNEQAITNNYGQYILAGQTH
jgi:hypothetical protein